MPLWLILHPEGTFEDLEAKRALSQDVTQMYMRLGLPAFYVSVDFIKLPSSDMFVGGELKAEKPFIRIAIDHIAVRLPNDQDVYKRTTSAIDGVLRPHIADKDYDWEYHVTETERGLWKINGLIPPAWKSEEEQLWAKENRAVPYPGSS